MIAIDQHRRRETTAGFTLIEVLVALAISAVVIVATAALIHNVALNFDRGTRSVTNADHLLLATERLAEDFASARPLPQTVGKADAQVAFSGEPARVRFVAAGGVAAGPQGEEVVSLTVEQVEGMSRLVRRRAKWLGPRTPFASLPLQDPVNLLEGRVDIAFAYGTIAADGKLTWSDSWSGQPQLPRLVRLTVQDHASGAELIPSPQFVLRADAPMACAMPGANADCLTGGKPQNAPAKDAQRGARG
jgi:prepilin-type N-terminal cleavage/methylation domain-containing protein